MRQTAPSGSRWVMQRPVDAFVGLSRITKDAVAPVPPSALGGETEMSKFVISVLKVVGASQASSWVTRVTATIPLARPVAGLHVMPESVEIWQSALQSNGQSWVSFVVGSAVVAVCSAKRRLRTSTAFGK